MPLKTPYFWYKPAGVITYALIPLAWLYQLGHKINQCFSRKTYKSTIPVICIGNAVAGGSGKTPTAISLMNLIQKNNLYKNPFFLTRGYGSKNKNSVIVDPTKHSFEDVGDEALLLARIAPTIVSPNRAEGAKLAELTGADLLIMDDGLLNNSLYKDLNFLVIDRNVDFGNGKTIPAGPLREPLSKILPKTDAVICIGHPFHSDKPVFEGIITPVSHDYSGEFIGFAGLARPQKFLNTLADLNLGIIGWYEFSDHHVYTEKELEYLLNASQETKAQLITTEKDFVRLPEDFKKHVKTLPIVVNFKDTNTIIKFIKEKLN